MMLISITSLKNNIPPMKTLKIILVVIWFTLLFGGIISLIFSCTPTKPNSITIIPATASNGLQYHILPTIPKMEIHKIIWVVNDAAIDYASGKVPFGICYTSTIDK